VNCASVVAFVVCGIVILGRGAEKVGCLVVDEGEELIFLDCFYYTPVRLFLLGGGGGGGGGGSGGGGGRGGGGEED